MTYEPHPFDTAIEIDEDCADFGFNWLSVEKALEQVGNEYQEVKQALENPQDQNHLQEEIGDLLQAVISVCLYCNFDPHDTLRKANDKFNRRMAKAKQLTNAQGLANLKEQTTAFKMQLWKQAKQ